jgi:ATP/maltotriose-dependent transcriptional regulator MalT
MSSVNRRSPQPPPLEAIYAMVVDEITGLPAPECVLILDDHHVIGNSQIHASLSFLLDHLPEPAKLHLVIVTRADPPLPLARYRVRGQLLEVRADNLRFTPEEMTSEKRDLLGNIACIRAVIASMSGEMGRAIELAHAADELLPADSYTARSIIPFTLGLAYRGDGDFERSAVALAGVVEAGEAAGNVWTISVGLYEIATTRRLQGRLRQAADIYRQAQRLAAKRGARFFGSIGKVDAGLSEVLREQNDLETARRLVVDSIQRMATWGSPADLLLAYTSLIQVEAARGDLSGAWEALQKAEELIRTHLIFPRLSKVVEICRV